MDIKMKILNKNTDIQYYTNFKLLNAIQGNPINNRDFLKEVHCNYWAESRQLYLRHCQGIFIPQFFVFSVKACSDYAITIRPDDGAVCDHKAGR